MLRADRIHLAHAENILNYPHSFDHVHLARALNSHLIDHVLVDVTFPLLLLRLICIIHNGFVKFPWLVLWLFTLFIYLTAVHYLQWVDHVPLARAFNAVKYSHWIDHVPLAGILIDVHDLACVLHIPLVRALNSLNYSRYSDHVHLARALKAINYSHWVDHVPLTRASADVIYSQCVHYSKWVGHVPLDHASTAVH